MHEGEAVIGSMVTNFNNVPLKIKHCEIRWTFDFGRNPEYAPHPKKLNDSWLLYGDTSNVSPTDTI